MTRRQPDDHSQRSYTHSEAQGRFFQQRRINAATRQAFGLRSASHRGRPAITFDVAPDLTRLRYVDGGDPRFSWHNPHRQPVKDRLYHAPNAADHIAAAGGVVWIASGESDLWALHSAGIYNALAWHGGEAAVPDQLADQLAALGVRSVNYAPDVDPAGHRAAGLLAAALGDDIALTCYALPVTLLDQSPDVGSVWATYDGAASTFDAYLLNLPTHDVTPAPPPAVVVVQADGLTVPADYLAEVRQAAEARMLAAGGDTRQNGDGWYRQAISNPTREDRNPSLRVCYDDGGLTACDVATGQTMSVYELGDALGVERPQSAPTAITTALHGLTRQALLRADLTPIARLLDALYAAGVAPGAVLTASEIASHTEIGRSTIYRMLDRLTDDDRCGGGCFQTSKGLHDRLSQLWNPLVSGRSLKAPFVRQLKSPGKTAARYRVPSPLEVAAACGLDDQKLQHVTPEPLPAEALKRDAHYRRAVYGEFVRRNPGQYARAALAALHGVGESTTRRWDKQLGIDVEPRYELHTVTRDGLERFPTRDELTAAIGRLKAGDDLTPTDRKALRIRLTPVLVDGKPRAATRENIAIAMQRSEAGTATLRQQKANHYSMPPQAAEAPPEAPTAAAEADTRQVSANVVRRMLEAIPRDQLIANLPDDVIAAIKAGAA